MGHSECLMNEGIGRKVGVWTMGMKAGRKQVNLQSD